MQLNNETYKTLISVIDSNIPDYPDPTGEELIKVLLTGDKPLDRWIGNSSMKQQGKVYLIPDEQNYRIIAVLRIIHLKRIQLSDLSTATIAESRHLIHSLKEGIKKIQERPHLLYGDKNAKEVNPDDLSIFNRFVDELESKSNRYYGQELVKEVISEHRVWEFKQTIKKQWEESRTLSKVFEYFDAVIYNPDEKLQWVGLHRINFQGAKIMFVERNYQKIYGIEWGHQINNLVFRFFIETINKSIEKALLSTNTFIDALDAVVDTNPESNIVFISYANSFVASRSLGESGRFVDYSDSRLTDFPFPVMGIYRDKLLIVPLPRIKVMGDGIIAMKFPGAMIMKRKTNENWIDQKLQFDITEITDENVEEVLLQSDPNADLSDQAMREKTKQNILIELDETIDFEVINPALITVVKVKERLD